MKMSDFMFPLRVADAEPAPATGVRPDLSLHMEQCSRILNDLDDVTSFDAATQAAERIRDEKYLSVSNIYNPATDCWNLQW